MIFKPHDYQLDAIKFILDKRCVGIFADPGLGKTAIVLAAIKALRYIKPDLKVLIIAPLRVCYSVWPQEIKKWNQFEDINYSIIHERFNDEFYDTRSIIKSKKTIHLINPESLIKLLDELEQNPFDMLIVDESTKFKSPKAKRFKTLKKHVSFFKNRIILTGTPIPNGLLDIWSQIFIVDGGISLGLTITKYRNRYFNQVNHYSHWTYELKNGADKHIYSAISPLTKRIDTEKYTDLPNKIDNIVTVDMPKKARIHYDELENDLFTEIENESVTVQSAASAYSICHQAANGAFYKETGVKDFYHLHDEKLHALEDLIDELHGKPTLVAYNFQHDLERIQKHFKKLPYIGSGVTPKESDKIIDKWNQGEIPILLGHPASIGHGLNLQSAGNDIIWFSLTDNLENYIQFNRRIWRQGVKGQVRIHHIVAKDTVDNAIMTRLKNKDENQTSLLNALRDYRNEREIYF